MLKRKLSATLSQEKSPWAIKGEESEHLHSSCQPCPSGGSSKYFPNMNQEPLNNDFVSQLLEIQRNLNISLNEINFLKPPICYVYNPTEYAKIPNELYFSRYCQSKKKLLFIGMNPGPFGMCQTGVPFGDINWVKNWLHIDGPVAKPPIECPNRPIQGFGCTRKEQSGDKFWKFWADLCGTPDVFFRNAFVYNYCPLAFMDVKGRNVTPADIKDKQLESICDRFYLEVIDILQPEALIAIGRYIEKRTIKILKNENINIPILYLYHPSPQSANNHNWADKARSFIDSQDLLRFFQ